MLRFEFLPARHGDSFLVRWGTPERVLVVDGGPDGVYEKVLRPHLAGLPSRPGRPPRVDVLCLSHVDEDHIVGVIRLLKELVRAKRTGDPPPFDIARLWFNSVDELVDGVQPGLTASVTQLLKTETSNVAVAASYAQGRDVRDGVAYLGLEGNPPFGGTLSVGANATLHGMDFTVVGPSTTSLGELVERWRASVQTNDAKAIAAAYVDRSVPNLSSIAFHVRLDGHTALLTGDARGDHLLKGLESAHLLSPGGSMHVDVFKIPHHGSENNAAPSLFERIRADHYVICADGIRHAHPSKKTLEWLVGSRAGGDKYTIHFTHPVHEALSTLGALAPGKSFKVAVGSPHVAIAFF